MRFLKPLAARSIKQDPVVLGLPDCGEFHGARAVKAEHDAARLVSPTEDTFGELKRVDSKLVLIAKGLVYVFSKIC